MNAIRNAFGIYTFTRQILYSRLVAKNATPESKTSYILYDVYTRLWIQTSFDLRNGTQLCIYRANCSGPYINDG